MPDSFKFKSKESSLRCWANHPRIEWSDNLDWTEVSGLGWMRLPLRSGGFVGEDDELVAAIDSVRDFLADAAELLAVIQWL